MYWCAQAQSCLTLCNPLDRSPPDSSVHGILQGRILEWVAISFSRGSPELRDRTRVSCTSCLGRQILNHSWEGFKNALETLLNSPSLRSFHPNFFPSLFHKESDLYGNLLSQILLVLHHFLSYRCPFSSTKKSLYS